jgi:hypothetical protein
LTLWRRITTNPPLQQTDEVLLENVDALIFTYGIDTNEDGIVNDWKNWNDVGGAKIIAVQVTLTGRPDQTNPDVKERVSPRTLASTVTFRNLTIK